MADFVLHEYHGEDVHGFEYFEVWTVWRGLRYSRVIYCDPLWGWSPTWDEVREDVRAAAMKGGLAQSAPSTTTSSPTTGSKRSGKRRR